MSGGAIDDEEAGALPVSSHRNRIDMFDLGDNVAVGGLLFWTFDIAKTWVHFDCVQIKIVFIKVLTQLWGNSKS